MRVRSYSGARIPIGAERKASTTLPALRGAVSLYVFYHRVFGYSRFDHGRNRRPRTERVKTRRLLSL